MWYRRKRYEYTIDREHGLGILFKIQDEKDMGQAFYEDDTFLPSVSPDSDRRDAIQFLIEFPERRWNWYRQTKHDQVTLDRMLSEGDCMFLPGGGGHLEVNLTYRDQQYQMRVVKSGRTCESVCSCGKTNCIHTRAAGTICQKRIKALKHAYVVTPQPVDKSIFLEQDLMSALRSLRCNEIDETLIHSIREILQMLDSARSADYYWLFHEFILDLTPYYGEYNARFLENEYTYFLLALFEDPEYRKAVLDLGGYADPNTYEGRQHRSNRVCFKRVLKEHGRVVREMDTQGDFRQDDHKEFLLKYRDDLPGLLRYYVQGKETLEPFDLPFIDRIAAAGLYYPEYIKGIAEKLDRMDAGEQTADIFQRLVGLLSPDQKVEVYSGVRNFILPMEELRNFGVDDQRKMINTIPLSPDSFSYIMDYLLTESSDREKGLFLVRTADRLRFGKDVRLKKAVADRAALLPDSRLLVEYIVYKMKLKGRWNAPDGDPGRELTAYFTCGYEIVREKNRFYTEFNVYEPESGFILTLTKEVGGSLTPPEGIFSDKRYPAPLIRRVCLQGREEEYRKAAELAQEAVDASIFHEKHKKFAGEYHQLCESLKDEKFLFTETAKAEIEWQIFREDGSNALSFRVGHNRMYVVKDAQEFIRAFKTGQTEEYGRDLILTHELANLNDTDAAVVRLIMSARYKKGRKSDKNNKRYITVSDSLLANMLETLTGRTILYNSIPCRLRMEPRSVRLQIDGKYVLSPCLGPGALEFLNLAGKGCLLSRSEDGKGAEAGMVMDQVDCTAEEIGLIDLVVRNPSVSIKPILGDFKKNIYARFFEMIDVDKSVQGEFVLSGIRINTYFDFEKNVVTARTDLLRDGKKISPGKIDSRLDQMKVDMLQDYLQALGFTDGILSDESHILAFFKLDFTRLKRLTNVYLSENLQNKELRSIGKPVIRVAYQNNLVKVFLEKSEYSENELEQIITGLRKKKKFILLSGDRIVDLGSETAKDLGEAVRDFGMNPKDLYKKKTISMVNAIKAFSHERSCRVDKYLRDMVEEIRSFKESDLPLPKLNGDLRDYQAEGFRWMSILSGYGMGGILADDMGLGKTIQVIALIRADRARKPSLVVCPKSLVFNWISEFARFDGTTRVTAIYGTDSQRTEMIEAINYKEKAVYITSYDSLRNDIGKYTGEFNYGILDEAQYIKNVNAQKTKSVKELRVAHRFALTGTPIENSVVDLWSIFDYIMPGYFEDLSQFKNTDPSDIARKSALFILRRVKEDVLEDLPAKYETILSADMTDEQRRLYDAMRLQARKQLEAGGKAFDLLPYLTRLRQVCVDPEMFTENYTGGSGKLDMLAELIPEYLEAGHRILIFSQFVKALEAVDRLLKKQSIPAYFLSGATPAAERIEMMDSFNNGSGTDVFLISLKAGGTGLNLTGADTVIHLDPWWNIAAENQASDRTHRIGQTRNVEVIRLIAADSIEQRVVELQEIKKEVIRQVISDDDGSVTSARLEDIAFVLE